MDRRRACRLAVTCLAVALAAVGSASAAREGGMNEVRVHSPALEGNFLGDSPDRAIRVYLPPGYDADAGRRYPVLYLLHGYPGERGGRWEFVEQIADTLTARQEIEPMIIVAPHSGAGCLYANSPVTGNWADFIVRDLTAYVDSTYRTFARPESRGIAGHSMGGSGAMALAMTHPDVYGAVYSASGGLGRVNRSRIVNSDAWPALMRMTRFPRPEEFASQFEFVRAAIWSPNPDRPPLFVDFPVEVSGGEVRPVESVLDRWDEQRPLGMLERYGANLVRLRGVRFDIGDRDWGLDDNRVFSKALSDMGVLHVYEEYDGDHANRLVERTGTHLLPFFSDVLAR